MLLCIYLSHLLEKSDKVNIMQNMNTVEKATYAVALIITLIGFGMSYLDHDWFKTVYVVEDGFTEWLTVIVLLIGMVVCIRRIIILHQEKSRLFLALTGLLSLMFLFGAGEEISWGQRIFQIESSEFFIANNAQGETNLHNLVVGGKKVNKIVFGTGLAIFMTLYLFVITPLYKKKKGVADFFDKLAVPIPQAHQVIAYVVAIVIIQVLMTSGKKGELIEIAGSMLFVINLMYPYNKKIFEPKSIKDPPL